MKGGAKRKNQSRLGFSDLLRLRLNYDIESFRGMGSPSGRTEVFLEEQWSGILWDTQTIGNGFMN